MFELEIRFRLPLSWDKSLSVIHERKAFYYIWGGEQMITTSVLKQSMCNDCIPIVYIFILQCTRYTVCQHS